MTVAQAGSVREAIEKVRCGVHLDVCVMDMRLPDMDGNAAVLMLHNERPELLFLIHTGTAGYTLPEELRQLGLTSDHVFLKPLTDMAPLASAVVRLAETGRYA
jgi:CheY-like chemotaxis protein